MRAENVEGKCWVGEGMAAQENGVQWEVAGERVEVAWGWRLGGRGAAWVGKVVELVVLGSSMGMGG